VSVVMMVVAVVVMAAGSDGESERLGVGFRWREGRHCYQNS
jgi:hypothetical protein